MSKLEKIKAELAKLLIKYSVVKTDKAVLEYDGEELVAGMDVYITDEEGNKVPAEDGEYVTEDNKTITVKDGKVESIVDKAAEVDAEEEKKEDEPMEEPMEEPMPEDKKEDEVSLEDVNTAISEMRKEIDELYKIVDSLLKKVGETRDEADERLKKLECKSLAKPASEEFEALGRLQKTGNKKLDKFLSAIKK